MSTRAYLSRAGAAVVVLTLAVATVACSPGPAQRAAANARAVGGTGSAPAPTASPSTATPSAQLSAALAAGRRGLTSEHLHESSDLGADGTVLDGVLVFSQGRVIELNLTQTTDGSPLRMLHVNGVSYVMLPSFARDASAKPWSLATAQSSNPVVASRARFIAGLTADTSQVASFEKFVDAATRVEKRGAVALNGQATTHWLLELDPSRLSATARSGMSSLALDLYVDSLGRPVQAVEHFDEGRRDQGSVTIAASDFNRPVSISPPPADQVSN